jgi:hypothetical protein
MSTRRSRSRDNSNSETAGRLANWQNPADSVVPYGAEGSESPDVDAMRGADAMDELGAGLDNASLRDDREVRMVSRP